MASASPNITEYISVAQREPGLSDSGQKKPNFLVQGLNGPAWVSGPPCSNWPAPGTGSSLEEHDSLYWLLLPPCLTSIPPHIQNNQVGTDKEQCHKKECQASFPWSLTPCTRRHSAFLTPGTRENHVDLTMSVRGQDTTSDFQDSFQNGFQNHRGERKGTGLELVWFIH